MSENAVPKSNKKFPWWGWVIVGVVAIGAIGALGGGGPDEASDTASVAEEPATEPQESEPLVEGQITPALECLAVAESLRLAIEDGVDDLDSGNSVTRAAAVKAPNFESENIWFVAAEIAGNGIEPGQVIGVWATNRGADDSQSGLIFSVDGGAKNFSSWGSTEGTDIEIAGNAAGIAEARACLQ